MVDKFAWKIAVGIVVLITAKILFSLIHEEPTFSDPNTPIYSIGTDGKTLYCSCSVGDNIDYLKGIQGTTISSDISTSISKVKKSTSQGPKDVRVEKDEQKYYDQDGRIGPWLTMKGFEDKLTIRYKGRSFEFKDPQISTSFWNEDKKSLHFLASGVAWRWREQDGFRKVISNIKGSEFGTFSSDGNYFAVNYDNSLLRVYSPTNELTEVIPSGYQFFGMLSLGKYLLVKGIEKEGYIWQPAKDMISALKFDGPICKPIAFNGALWGVQKVDKVSQVVRLDPSFDKIAQRIALD